MSLTIKFSNNNFRLSAGDEYYNLFDSSATPKIAYDALSSQANSDFIANKYYLDDCIRDGWMTIDENGQISYVKDDDKLTGYTILYPNYKRVFLSNTSNKNLSPSAVISNLIPTYKELSVITRIKETLTGIISIDNAYSTSATYNEASYDFLSVHNSIANTVFSNQISNYTGSYDVELKISQDAIILQQDKINRTIEGFVLPNRPDVIVPNKNFITYVFKPSPQNSLNQLNYTYFNKIHYYETSITDDEIIEKCPWSQNMLVDLTETSTNPNIKNYKYFGLYKTDSTDNTDNYVPFYACQAENTTWHCYFEETNISTAKQYRAITDSACSNFKVSKLCVHIKGYNAVQKIKLQLTENKTFSYNISVPAWTEWGSYKISDDKKIIEITAPAAAYLDPAIEIDIEFTLSKPTSCDILEFKVNNISGSGAKYSFYRNNYQYFDIPANIINDTRSLITA